MHRPSVLFVRVGRFFCGALVWAAIFIGHLSAQATLGAPSQQLYLLAGTSTNHGTETFPVVLYQVGSDKKLKIVRDVVPQTDGLFAVYGAGNVLFVLHPHINPTTVSVIHFDKPGTPDDVIFNSQGIFPVLQFIVAAEPPATAPVLLVPLGQPRVPKEGMLASISSASNGGGRVQFDRWGEYAALRLDGEPGGPALNAGLFGSKIDYDLTISFWGHPIHLSALPPSLQGIKIANTLYEPPVIVGIIAASERYLVLSDSSGVFVGDRKRNSWKAIQVEEGACRMFGDWLAFRLGMVSQVPESAPGRQTERDAGTDRMPNVRSEYENSGSKMAWSGTQVLQNLVDGRKIRIETDQEDSEILTVRGDTVLYRVNDAIYLAKIAGDKLQGVSMVVKDEDVPEVHWVFGSSPN